MLAQKKKQLYICMYQNKMTLPNMVCTFDFLYQDVSGLYMRIKILLCVPLGCSTGAGQCLNEIIFSFTKAISSRDTFD